MEQKVTLCPHCKESVNPKATRCPHCHGKITRVTKAMKVTAFIIGFIIIISIFSGNKKSEQGTSTSNSAETPTATVPGLSKEQAQAELDDFMKLAKGSGLVTSYDFSKLTENVYRWDIFVGPIWYTQTVQQKKDFMGYMGIHKKAITGFSNFEVHDDHTNEKVAEITAFGQEIKIYK